MERAVVSLLLLHRPGFWRIASPHEGQLQFLLLYVIAEVLPADTLNSLPITQACTEFSTDQHGAFIQVFLSLCTSLVWPTAVINGNLSLISSRGKQDPETFVVSKIPFVACS